ncbi:hypothetical protein SCV69_07780 [Legionella pneumophila serogroup 1]|uniref:hypothetical protein n=1 Tax=Legionella pneumophila TaxID=446 RepID=UPI000770A31F|nr:hypothetical protein [Legionella pneumophila]HAT8874844.1 hypothetical protein [Legionella pneumophila subsp. pneumophila]CZG51283.1 Uncharacterized protein conserved in bacteria [Legionella pneumophila]CZG65471.1 Uncharacterized protein conserved in bacteria [Legionella pneumophila]HAT8948508.1 hypothetical protein [Legionella pneumophila subsp. pneumophila]HAT9144237.1 hypothetical protein [Legionella pneumophila subsp. pneumophila]
MKKLNIKLKNCYGIKSLEKNFNFSSEKNKNQVYAIYAPNGLMKSSFAKTFDEISKGNSPKEERYGRNSSCQIEMDGQPIEKEMIYVLKSELDINSDNPAMTDILVNPKSKARYDELLLEVERSKTEFINSLQDVSGLKKSEIEDAIVKDWGDSDFLKCIRKIMSSSLNDDLFQLKYGTIFDPKVLDILKNDEFLAKAKEFHKRYQELFTSPGTIYEKGVFNPKSADKSFSTLDTEGYFKGGHRIHLKGDENSIDQKELEKRVEEINSRINEDNQLKRIQKSLAKNAQTQAFTLLIETMPSAQIEFLLEKLKPENQIQFRKDLWTYYIQGSSQVHSYLNSASSCEQEITTIEKAAAKTVPQWEKAVELFNARFIDMPFSLAIPNHAQAVLGKEQARLSFIFQDGKDRVEWSRAEIKTLSQGEKRALYLLNFIFEVEARKLSKQTTIYVLDDIADSFDYKNKHAILQYLEDLCEVDFFYQIILTHNFDFYRSLAMNFVPYERCLMSYRNEESIELIQAEGIKNYFINKWKNNITQDNCILCASIPFVRNLIEYIRGEDTDEYKKLTSLLHWKKETQSITVREYICIYNNLFGTKHNIGNDGSIVELIFSLADEICKKKNHKGLNLEDKVLLSIAIRLQAEKYLTLKLREIKNDNSYWCEKSNQFGALIKEFTKTTTDVAAINILEKVSITVSSNIHLNSFMYEPILDLTIEHLIDLYSEILAMDK